MSKVRQFPGREKGTVGEAYRAALKVTGGVCPIEAGIMGYLADNECRHGRLHGDRTPPCGCWPGETQTVVGKDVKKAA